MFPRLRDLRENRNLTQAQLAGIIHMSQTGYSKYETGENDIPTSVLIKLSEYYGTSVDYILGLTDRSEPYVLSSSRLPEATYLIHTKKTARSRIR